MQWIAPSEKDTATDALEKRLWDAADQLRANNGLTSAQYSTPVLGLINCGSHPMQYQTALLLQRYFIALQPLPIKRSEESHGSSLRTRDLRFTNQARAIFEMLGVSNVFPVFSVKTGTCVHSIDSIASRCIGGF